MDPLSLSSGIAGLLSLAIQLAQTTSEYVSSARDATKTISSFQHELLLLRQILEKLEQFLQHQSEGHSFHDSSVICSTVDACRHKLEQLLSDLARYRSGGRVVRSLMWPFREADTRQAVVDLHRYATTFQFCLTVDGCELLGQNASTLAKTLARQVRILDDTRQIVGELEGAAQIAYATRKELLGLMDESTATMTTVAKGVEKIQDYVASDHDRKVLDWLSPVHPSSNHNSARRKHEATTGNWLLDSKQFITWKKTAGSFLWLSGIPGCGKTIICSTVIDYLEQHDADLPMAYFYFDFNDSKKKSVHSFLCSILVQLSGAALSSAVKALFNSCGRGTRQPSLESVMKTLKQVLEEIPRVLVILDALDECAEREELMACISEICGWSLPVQLLATSRRERTIEDALTPLVTGHIYLESELVDHDIRTFIKSRLMSDTKLKRWSGRPEIMQEIETALLKGSQGMFRWVFCQLEELKKCIKLSNLRKALQSLPKSLDETYERILTRIPEEYADDVLRVLQFLAFADRPVSIDEVSELLAVNLSPESGGHPYFDPEQRLPEPHDIVSICSSLVITVPSEATWMPRRFGKDSWYAFYDIVDELRLAHASVKDFVLSERIESGPAARYSITASSSHAMIAESCLAYLLQFETEGSWKSHSHFEYPLAHYATCRWNHHARFCDNDNEAAAKIRKLKMLLMRDNYRLNMRTIHVTSYSGVHEHLVPQQRGRLQSATVTSIHESGKAWCVGTLGNALTW